MLFEVPLSAAGPGTAAPPQEESSFNFRLWSIRNDIINISIWQLRKSRHYCLVVFINFYRLRSPDLMVQRLFLTTCKAMPFHISSNSLLTGPVAFASNLWHAAQFALNNSLPFTASPPVVAAAERDTVAAASVAARQPLT
jgi:hypothetical protein